MKLKKNTCFVIMGFGKKNHTDFGITFDLDKAYQKIIRPAAEKLGYECIRANEIDDSGLIEKSMYAILMQADLVIAYVTTDNANAMYEVMVQDCYLEVAAEDLGYKSVNELKKKLPIKP